MVEKVVRTSESLLASLGVAVEVDIATITGAPFLWIVWVCDPTVLVEAIVLWEGCKQKLVGSCLEVSLVPVCDGFKRIDNTWHLEI